MANPAPEPDPAQDAGPFFHGTRADMRPGDLLTPGWGTNYGSGKTSRHIYLTASEHGAPLAAALALGDGAPRVYRVEPPSREDMVASRRRDYRGETDPSFVTHGPKTVAELALLRASRPLG